MWVRYYSKKILGPYLGHLPVTKAQKYMALCRIVYFFSATSLGILIWKAKGQYEKQQLESGKPFIVDHSDAHRKLRKKNADVGLIYTYKPGLGFTSVEFDKKLYLQQIEKESLERAKAAQRRLIEEGKQLDPEAIRLIQ